MKVLLTATVQSHICQFHKPLVEVLHKYGCEVHVAARDNLEEKNGLKLDFVEKVYNIPFARSPKSMDNIEAYRQLKKIINSGKYNIIHCNTPMGGIVTRLAARSARKNGTKVFYTAHGFHFYKGAPIKNWIVFYPIERLFSRFTDVLITITHEDYAFAKERFYCDVEYIHGVGVNESRYHSVCKDEQLKIREEFGIKPEKRIILCVGELLPNKNQQMAIRMMQKVLDRIPEAELLIAGNGPEKRKLEQLITDLGLGENVQMLGYCTCLEKYQRIIDVLVACSHREGLPLNLVEAMLSENPIVATTNRGHKELVKSGETGYLVNDLESMSSRVIEILTDDALCSKMGRNAKKYATYYGACNVKIELEKIYFDKLI